MKPKCFRPPSGLKWRHGHDVIGKADFIPVHKARPHAHETEVLRVASDPEWRHGHDEISLVSENILFATEATISNGPGSFRDPGLFYVEADLEADPAAKHRTGAYLSMPGKLWLSKVHRLDEKKIKLI
jgi:hypothetical protein